MQEFLNNPAVVIAIIALIGAITNWINSLSRNSEISSLIRQTAKHEEQLNGGFAPKVQAIANPIVTGALKRLDDKPGDIPKVQ